MFYFTIQ
jgi:hypothetical protein